MALLLLSLVPTEPEAAGPVRRKAPRFVYDQADHTAKAVMLSGGELYDPGVASKGNELWVTWLKFVPGKGDEIHVGRGAAGPQVNITVSTRPGRYARPTLTLDAAGVMWLSYEAFDVEGQQWDVFVRPHTVGMKFTPRWRVSSRRKRPSRIVTRQER